MRYLSALLVIAIAACGDSSGPGENPNFAIINRSGEPATLVLHQADFTGGVWVPRPDTAYLLTIQPTVCTDVLLNVPNVSGQITTPSDTFALAAFALDQASTTTISVEPGAVVQKTRARGLGCNPVP